MRRWTTTTTVILFIFISDMGRFACIFAHFLFIVIIVCQMCVSHQQVVGEIVRLTEDEGIATVIDPTKRRVLQHVFVAEMRT